MALGFSRPVALRVAVALFGLAIAFAAFVHAASETERFPVGQNPPDRLGLDAHIAGAWVDAGFRSEMAKNGQSQNQFPRMPEELIDLARRSYAVDPLEASLLRTIALGDVLQVDKQRADRLMRLAAEISKRDSITNLWLAQDYGRAGDVEAMIGAFDAALRTNVRAREFAMKPVVEALGSPESYASFAELLAKRPEWEWEFWREFARNPVGNANAVGFFRETGISVNQIPNDLRRNLYVNLKRSQNYQALNDLAALDSDARSGLQDLRDGKFVSIDSGNPLGWALYSRGNFAARLVGATRELQIDARSGSFAVAADRPARGGGRQRVTVGMAEPVPPNVGLELAVRCADSTRRKLAIVALETGDSGGQADFSSNCDFVILELSFESEPGRQDALIRVASIALTPAETRLHQSD